MAIYLVIHVNLSFGLLLEEQDDVRCAKQEVPKFVTFTDESVGLDRHDHRGNLH